MIETRMRIDKKKFGSFIATRREQIKGIQTQEDLAEKIHVSVGYIGKLESGGGLPSFELFIDLADALLMTPGELMMVLAERENQNQNYMEMNDWLYEHLVVLIEEYKQISSGEEKPQKPPTQMSDLREKNKLALERAREAARNITATEKETQLQEQNTNPSDPTE